MTMAAGNRQSWQATATPLVPARASGRPGRGVIVASADAALRGRVVDALAGLRWKTGVAAGGAELFIALEQAALDQCLPGAILLDSWLPDLDAGECVRELTALYPGVDVMALDGADLGAPAARGPFRNEVLHVLSQAQRGDDAVGGASQNARSIPYQVAVPDGTSTTLRGERERSSGEAARNGGDRAAWAEAPSACQLRAARPAATYSGEVERAAAQVAAQDAAQVAGRRRPGDAAALPELLGSDPRMLEVGRRIRLVAGRSTAVLVQGPTGTGKELVARALHRLSPRADKPFVALNCAAIPEALLEAELFGHTRGAFTGATQGRIGRLEAANGGTLFLDEIGELPLALQAKLLRFVECGELQRVGENEPVRVDVRVIAATHRELGKMAEQGSFRADLYYRLSVFLIRTPALVGRAEDITQMAEHALARLARREPAKRLSAEALMRLAAHAWPGNVRELEHTMERAWILAEDRDVIEAEEIDFGGEPQCD